jgi:molybdopterin/thiamine biosynthesis adenylyltransferase
VAPGVHSRMEKGGIESTRAFAEAVERHVKEIEGIRTLPIPRLDEVAAEHGLSRLQVEIAVLKLGILPLRYLKNYGTVGLEGQVILLSSTVAVLGLGGLGGYVVEGLSRMGVGRLVLADGDVFCEHNLNRQVLSGEGNLGQSKVQVCAERVRRINRAVEVSIHPYYATRENLSQWLAGVDVVVDALDRLPTRLMVQEVAAKVGVPMVHGAIAGWVGQIMTVFPGDPGLRVLYGDGPVPEQGAEVEQGCPPASPMMVAAWQVHETVKILLDRGDLIRGRMLFLDAAVGEVRALELG